MSLLLVHSQLLLLFEQQLFGLLIGVLILLLDLFSCLTLLSLHSTIVHISCPFLDSLLALFLQVLIFGVFRCGFDQDWSNRCCCMCMSKYWCWYWCWCWCWCQFGC